jgi:hypothetical protein
LTFLIYRAVEGSMLATDYGIDGGYESKSKVQFEVVQRTYTKQAKF